jgi:hypothetical protein
MKDASCRREDIIAAYQDLVKRLHERRRTLWNAYLEATQAMGRREYLTNENECWSVLTAGISGIDAESQVLQREYELRLASVDGSEAVA